MNVVFDKMAAILEKRLVINVPDDICLVCQKNGWIRLYYIVRYHLKFGLICHDVNLENVVNDIMIIGSFEMSIDSRPAVWLDETCNNRLFSDGSLSRCIVEMNILTTINDYDTTKSDILSSNKTNRR